MFPRSGKSRGFFLPTHERISKSQVVQIDAEDKVAVRRCLAGDLQAFEVLIERYQKLLYSVAFRVLHNREDAMDATQSAFIKAYEKLDAYDPAFKFFSWIYKILVNESLNQLSRRKTHEELDIGILDPNRTPEEEHGEELLQELVQSAVVRLPVDYRKLILLRHFGDLSYRDIGEALDLPESTVKSRLFIARRMLRELLQHPVGRT